MKPFLVLLFFGFLILIFIGGALGQHDLTPDTPPAAGGENTSGALLLPAAQGNGSSVCASSYTVRKGDTLSQLAKSCSLALEDLLAANPQINNADLIYEGQVINIPRVAAPALAGVPSPTAAQAVVAAPLPTATAEVALAVPPAAVGPSPTVDAIFSAFETARAPGGGGDTALPVVTPRPDGEITGLKPGTLVKVSVAGFPANVPVEVGIGQVGKDPFMIDESVTDAQGVAAVVVAVPANARVGERWTVTITTIGRDPQISATAAPFTIGQ